MNYKGVDFNFLSDSIYKEPFEWVSDKEIATYRNSMLASGLNHVYPDLHIKGTVMQIEKALINNPLRVSKVS